jgi:hypothetical protein
VGTSGMAPPLLNGEQAARQGLLSIQRPDKTKRSSFWGGACV